MPWNRYKLKDFVLRARQGWRWMRGTLTREDARDMQWKIDHLAGWYPLVVLSVDDIKEQLEDMYESQPQFDELADRAASRVYSKFDDYSDMRSNAQDWAVDLVRDYAVADRVALIERNN